MDLTDALDHLLPDPPPTWSPVPAHPADPGAGWESVRVPSTGLTVWRRPVDDDGAPGWARARSRYADTGLWPLLVDDDFWTAVELEPTPLPPMPASTRDWIVGTLRDGEEPLLEQLQRSSTPELVPDGEGPQLDLLAALQPATHLVLVPVDAPWRVPQFLGWDGAVNHEVLDHQHTCVLGRWAALYGAELVQLTRDVAVLWVARPPRTPETALGAALEAFAYCPDVVFQGVGTIDALIAMVSAPTWVFWWD